MLDALGAYLQTGRVGCLSRVRAGADERGGEESEDDGVGRASVLVHDVGGEGLGACWECGVGGSRGHEVLLSFLFVVVRSYPRPR